MENTKIESSKPGSSLPNHQDSSGVISSRAPADAWDMSQERAFIENLLCERFNFLLVFYSLVVAGAFSTSSRLNFSIALTLGALICSLLSLPIARAQHKLDLILKRIWVEQPDHPSKKTNDWASDLSAVPWLMRWSVRGSRRGAIGYWIPLLCSASLWVGAILSWFRIVGPGD